MHRFLNAQKFRLKWIIFFALFIFVGTLLSNEHFDTPSSSQTNRTTVSVKLVNRSSNFSFNNLKLSVQQIYHLDGIAYDFYSKDEFNRTEAAEQWNSWPLLDKNIITSPSIISRLPFVQAIYMVTDPRLVDRHENLRKAFQRQGLSMDLVQWRLKWNQTTCNDPSNLPYVVQRLNLKTSALNEAQQKRCALVMKHVDVWYEMAEKNISLGLILEDDAIFVPFFKEKFTRMIFAALNQRILRFDGHCAETNQSIDQDPMLVLGTCFHFHDRSFQSTLANARPIFSRQKRSASRCAHAYLLTSCSAKALVREIQRDKNDFWPPDFLQNHLFLRSPTLESFWLDPSLVYQGNQVIDLDGIETFRRQTYL